MARVFGRSARPSVRQGRSAARARSGRRRARLARERQRLMLRSLQPGGDDDTGLFDDAPVRLLFDRLRVDWRLGGSAPTAEAQKANGSSTPARRTAAAPPALSSCYLRSVPSRLATLRPPRGQQGRPQSRLLKHAQPFRMGDFYLKPVACQEGLSRDQGLFILGWEGRHPSVECGCSDQLLRRGACFHAPAVPP